MPFIKNRRSCFLFLLFCLSISLIATLWGYNYSAGNAEEQLPLIYRAMDSSYLPNDFFTNTSGVFGPRTLYNGFLALLAGIFPLSAVLFSLTFLCNAAIAWISALIASRLFNGSKSSVYLAAAAVLTIKTFWIGYSNIIYRNYLEPAHIAMPFLLLGFFFLLEEKFIPASIVFGIASIFHPLLGMETGWFLLGSFLLFTFFQIIKKEKSIKSIKNLALALVIFAGICAALLIPYSSQPSIPEDVFINIIAYVRHPHHYLPSTFEKWQFGQAGVFLLAFVLIFHASLQRSSMLRQNRVFFWIISTIILLLCIGGYLFVEVWPSRLWTMAQMFRLPYLIKWFSIVLIAGWAGSIIDTPQEDESRLFGYLTAVSMVTPVSLAITAGIRWARTVILPKYKNLRYILNDYVAGGLALASIFIYKPELRTCALFLFFFLLIVLQNIKHWNMPAGLFASGAALILSAVFILFGTVLTPPQMIKNEFPVFPIYKITSETAEIAKFARENTPEDAIFLTPPKYGAFRYMAERAIIVDLVAFPFQDNSMLEWYDRMMNCYGASAQLGFNALSELNRNYAEMSHDKVRELSKIYNADYAVLYDVTNVDFPVLYRTKSFKLVKIPRD